MIGKFLCFMSLHKWGYKGVSRYRQADGLFGIMELAGRVYQCERCEKISSPKWWKKEYRDKHSPLDVAGRRDIWERDVTITGSLTKIKEK